MDHSVVIEDRSDVLHQKNAAGVLQTNNYQLGTMIDLTANIFTVTDINKL